MTWNGSSPISIRIISSQDKEEKDYNWEEQKHGGEEKHPEDDKSGGLSRIEVEHVYEKKCE